MKKLRTLAVASAALVSAGTFSAVAALPAASAATATAAAKTTTLTLEANPKGLLSFNTKSLKAKAGTVVIKFTNKSKVGHDVAVEKGSSGKGKAIGQTPVFSGGTKTLTLKNLKAGTYTFFCTVPGHRQAGMVGTLTVTK